MPVFGVHLLQGPHDAGLLEGIGLSRWQVSSELDIVSILEELPLL